MTCVTIKSLAKHLGISPSTVFRFLQDHPAISKATREKVQNLAAQYNYQPNMVAKILQRKKSKTIGVIVPDIRHDFFSSAISGIEEVAHRAGYLIMISQSQENCDLEVQNTMNMASRRVAGLIVPLSRETVHFDHLARVMQQSIPVVLRVTDKIPTH